MNDYNKKGEKIVEPVTKNKVVRHKPSVGKKIFESFIKDDLSTMKEHLIWDVWVPTVREYVRDSLVSSVDAIFGRGGGTGMSLPYKSTLNSSYSHTPYDKASRRTSIYKQERARTHAMYGFDDIVMHTAKEANEVVEQLNDIIETYGVASVQDYYISCGETSEPTDCDWGWSNKIPISVRRVRTGYIAVLPRPIKLS